MRSENRDLLGFGHWKLVIVLEEPMGAFVKVARVDDVSPGRAKRVDLAGRRLAIFNLNGHFQAMDDACNHRGGPLSEGEVEGDAVVCPWHGAKFNVTTGELLGGPGRGPVRSYPTRVNGQDVEIEL
jgi:nitrite reductase/ring-hydroxylating ferredoxin subunit